MENKNNEQEREIEVSEPAVKYGNITPTEFWEMTNDGENRFEYYDGYVIKLDAVCWQHDTIEHNLSRKIELFLDGKGCKVMGPNMPVGNATAKSYMLPDRIVLCEKMLLSTKFKCLLNPAVIFEVLSPSNREIDMEIKRQYYQEFLTLQEYIMVDSQKREIIVVRKQFNNKWGPDEIITGNNNLLIKTIGYHLPLQEIYRDTGL